MFGSSARSLVPRSWVHGFTFCIDPVTAFFCEVKIHVPVSMTFLTRKEDGDRRNVANNNDFRQGGKWDVKYYGGKGLEGE